MKTIFSASASAYTLALILSACGGTSQAPDSRTSAINGTVQGRAKGAGTVELPALTGSRTLASATLDAGGRFNLPLPSASALSSELQTTGTGIVNEAGCNGSFSSSDPQALGVSVTSLRVSKNGAVLADIRPITAQITENTSTRGAADISGNIWVYVDRPTQLSGSVRCTGSSQGLAITLTRSVHAGLRTGWNVLGVGGQLTATPASADITINYGNGQDGPSIWADSSSSTAVPLSVNAWASRPLAGITDLLERAPLFKK